MHSGRYFARKICGQREQFTPHNCNFRRTTAGAPAVIQGSELIAVNGS